jgi:hypothetical protein
VHEKLGQVYELDPGHASNQIGQQQQKMTVQNAVCEIAQHLIAK